MSSLQEMDEILRHNSNLMNTLMNNYIDETNILMDELIYSPKEWEKFQDWINTNCIIERENYEMFKQFSGLLLEKDVEYLKYKSKGYLDLSIEKIGDNTLAISHYFEQCGDLMSDPDIEFYIDEENKMLLAFTYQNDLVAYFLDASDNRDFQKHIGKFLNTWFKSLDYQGHKLVEINTADKSYNAFENPYEFINYCKSKGVKQYYPIMNDIRKELYEWQERNFNCKQKINTKDLSHIAIAELYELKLDSNDCPYYTDKKIGDMILNLKESSIEIYSNNELLIQKKFENYNDLKTNYLDIFCKNACVMDIQSELKVKELIQGKSFNTRQINEIREGVYSEIDVTVYLDPSFNDRQMHQLRLGLENGINVESYRDSSIEWEDMENQRLQLESEMEMSF